jgi:tetratricopeptide (TPR) repeat protein
MDMKSRSQEDDRQMLYLAHASRYHWGLVGAPRNRAIGEWQISRVYADLGQPELALQFARASLATSEKNSIKDCVHTANEAIARAYAVAKDYKNARKYLEKARHQLDKLSLDNEDRKIYSDQISETEALIPK